MAGKSGRSLSNIPERSLKKTLLSWEAMLVLIFILVNLYGTSISANYLLKNILREMPKYLTEMFLLLPMIFVLVLGDIDISVGANVCFSATMASLASNKGLPFILVCAVCLLSGLACGLLNGIILTKFTELPPMIVTLGTQIVFRGIAEIALGSGGSVSVKNFEGLMKLNGTVKLGEVGVPYVLIIILLCMVAFALVLSKTTFGRYLYAIGSNRTAAHYAGIPVEKIRLTVFTLTGLMSGICALFLMSILYGANTTTGNGFEMDAIAMAVFGGVSTAGGKGRVFGAAISAFTITCLRISLGLINLNPQVILLILGTLLVLAVMLPNLLGGIKLNGLRTTKPSKTR